MASYEKVWVIFLEARTLFKILLKKCIKYCLWRSFSQTHLKHYLYQCSFLSALSVCTLPLPLFVGGVSDKVEVWRLAPALLPPSSLHSTQHSTKTPQYWKTFHKLKAYQQTWFEYSFSATLECCPHFRGHKFNFRFFHYQILSPVLWSSLGPPVFCCRKLKLEIFIFM